ncbi:hypothetical protein TSUD_246430 [Trifolium subterraneum]|uniref:Transposase (putative) gypsy type domain-containing protein n=1 Tax=Trifolium subterraneum TaxID=3900 RepID=A0A2Z6P6E8_TRISU|nr:hypothetical protein TSUD_246430 [Trifolium subterraneum]
MYQIAFEHMGLRLPFSDLEVTIFNHLELCPSQLHPNYLAFIRAFEIVAAYLELVPTISLFFHLFGIQRSRPRGNVTDKCGWVSLKQNKRFFEMFEESIRGFKDMWYIVCLITSVGWKTIIVRGPKLDDEGNVVLGPNDHPLEVHCERFPFCWSRNHYLREAKSFTFKKGDLSKEELADAKILEDFVDNFPINLWADKEGSPLYEENGREMKNTQLTLRKLQAEKKKREADTRPPKNARTDGGGSSTVGGHKLIPGIATAEFVLPPVMGHECLLDGKTKVKIAPADETILASMGRDSIRNVVAESSVVVFKLLEIATFLNGRECTFLRERDEARAQAKDFGERLTVVEKHLSSQTKAFEDSQAQVTKLEKELKDAKEEEEKLKEKVVGLEEKLSSLTLAPIADKEEKKLDPTGIYAKFSWADLIAKIYQVGDLQLEVASFSFQNALAKLQVLNPGVQLVTDGLDELKEVRDGQIATPPLKEE